jgi:hypothetical protein
MAIAGIVIGVLGVVMMPTGVDGPGGTAWMLGLLWLAATSVVLAQRERAPRGRPLAV